jgi:glycosyltransferase involved in cell wall biosynthesis
MIGNYLPAGKWNKNIWHHLAERMQSSGWRVITTSGKEKQLTRLIDMLSTIWRQRHHYAIAQIDLFSGKAFVFAEACVLILKTLQKPIVLTLHGGRLPDFSKKNPGRMKRVLGVAAVVVTPSPFIQSTLSQFRSDIRLIPNPIDLSSAIFRLREEPTPKLIWVRAFHGVYNPSLVPKVIKRLESEFPGIQCWMLGPDKGDGSLKRMLETAKLLGVENKVIVVGGVPHTEVPMWLDKADIFINTTNYDTAPRSLLEAMANGLCVVSTDVGGVSYILDDGISGFLVPPDDAKAMAKAIQLILSNPGLGQKLSCQARKRAEKNDWSTILPQWDRLFNEILESHCTEEIHS